MITSDGDYKQKGWSQRVDPYLYALLTCDWLILLLFVYLCVYNTLISDVNEHVMCVSCSPKDLPYVARHYNGTESIRVEKVEDT